MLRKNHLDIVVVIISSESVSFIIMLGVKNKNKSDTFFKPKNLFLFEMLLYLLLHKKCLFYIFLLDCHSYDLVQAHQNVFE